MRALITLVLSALAVSSSFAFVPTVPAPRHSLALRNSPTDTGADVPIKVVGQNIDLTPALVEYVDKRIGKLLNKLSRSGGVKECDVVLSVSRNPKVSNKHRVEVIANLKGTSVICHNESPDMYESIDSAAHALSRKLCKYKERRVRGHHGEAAMSADFIAALEALEDERPDFPVPASASVKKEAFEDDAFFDDPFAPKITKVKSYDLDKPMSVQEAVFALDYTDHDFYVFRNSETNQVSVVYKRHVGGVGLIEP